MRVLVAGWFSFPQMGASAGDLLACEVVCQWLHQAGCPYEIAFAEPFAGGVDWRIVDPSTISDVLFVCGPFGNGWPIPEFLQRFTGCRLTGVNLSMLEPLDFWNPFDQLFERDSSRCARPDITLLTPPNDTPVVGVVLAPPQREYRNGLHGIAHVAIERLIASRSMAVVRIDTRLDVNGSGLRTAHEVDSLIGRMDVVLTTRLHGLVLAIKNGVPPLAIDPIAGGAKVSHQAAQLGWPATFRADSVSDEDLRNAFEWAISADAKTLAGDRRARGIARLGEMRTEFISRFASDSTVSGLTTGCQGRY